MQEERQRRRCADRGDVRQCEVRRGGRGSSSRGKYGFVSSLQLQGAMRVQRVPLAVAQLPACRKPKDYYCGLIPFAGWPYG